MDFTNDDATLQAILGRSDFVGGIDNEALDFSQLEAFINSGDGSPEGHSGPASYFADTLQADNSATQNGISTTTIPTSTAIPIGNPGGKLVNVIVDNKRGHHLPESPPDSGSEHPYSPAETGDPHHPQQLATSATADLNNGTIIYTTLNSRGNVQNGVPSTNGNVTTSPSNSSVLFKHHQHHHQHHQHHNGGELLSPMLNANDHNLILTTPLHNQQPHQHHPQMQQILNQPTTNRCMDTIPQGCVYIQSQPSNNDPSQNHHILQASTPTSAPPNRSDYSNRNDFKLSLSHELDSVMIHSPMASRVNVVPTTPAMTAGHPMDGNLENIQSVYTTLQNASKKRKLSHDVSLVKSEPELSPDSRPTVCSPMDPAGEYSLDVSVGAGTIDSNSGPGSVTGGHFADGAYRTIEFKPFQQSSWYVLTELDKSKKLVPYYTVEPDKGFNFSNADDAFVCQKKNHFQITCQVQIDGAAHFVEIAKDHHKEIISFYLHFYGVKFEAPDQIIKVEQSQSDRSKKPFHPVLVHLKTNEITKIQVGRLHFSETTSNNMRKKGKPNPEQRYFRLVVGLYAHTDHNEPFPIKLLASERIIVRASNPGQFESDIEPCWQKGQTNDSIFHAGKVGINTDRPEEAIDIHGNIKLTGHIVQPSDLRAKRNIIECNTAEQLKNVQNLRVVRFNYHSDYALQSGFNADPNFVDTGVIAQEVAQVLPDAVTTAGSIILSNGEKIDNFLVVNKERIFMENVGAVKELCKVTDNLENRIDQLERINRRLSKLKRGDSMKSTASSTCTNSKYHIGSQKCDTKSYHNCSKQSEICSNKLIQIIIVVLILIMAFCLAAITTLYFLESRHHNHRFQDKFLKSFELPTMKPSLFTDIPTYVTSAVNAVLEQDAAHLSSINNVKNTKIYPKPKPWIKDNAMPVSELNFSTESGQKQKPISTQSTQSTNVFSQNENLLRSPSAIGRPAFCHSDSELDGSSCQVYCCLQEVIDNGNVEGGSDTAILDDEKHLSASTSTSSATQLEHPSKSLSNNGVNHSAVIVSTLANENIKNTKAIHSNNIARKEVVRERRESFLRRDIYSIEEENLFSDNIETLFTLIVQGRHFNVTLGPEYCYECNLPMNVTYSVPISKYMPDDYLYLNFRHSQSNVKELEFCVNNQQQNDCQPGFWGEQQTEPKNAKEAILSQIDEKNGFRTHGTRFQIDMIGFLDKMLIYRASLSQNIQNVCDLPTSKLGIDFLEYNIHFYRDCED